MTAALRAQDRQHRADDFQRAEKVGVEIARDLFIAEFPDLRLQLKKGGTGGRNGTLAPPNPRWP